MYLVYRSVPSNKEVINRYEDYEDAKLCQAHLIRAREVKKRQRISESMKFLLAQELRTTRSRQEMSEIEEIEMSHFCHQKNPKDVMTAVNDGTSHGYGFVSMSRKLRQT